MASPWTMLGLEPGQRDERSIKRAYAKLLKQHRPDQDPEGFRRVHDAYQRALAMADEDEEESDDDDDAPVSKAEHPVTVTVATRSSGTSSPVVEPPVRMAHLDQKAEKPPEAAPQPTVDQTPAPVVAPPPEVKQVPTMTPWDRAVADLEIAAGQPSGPLRDEALTVVFRRLARLVTERRGGADALVALLNRHLPVGRVVWRHIFSDDDLLAELRRGESELAGHTLRGCFEAGDWQRLRTFAERWMELDADELQAGDAIALTRVLAVWLAPFEYTLADRLVGYLPMRLRREADHELDTLLAVGRDLVKLPEASRAYLCALLAGHLLPGGEDLRWRTGALLSQLAPDALARRVLEQRAAGHFAGLAAPSQAGNVNLLSVVFVIVGMALLGAGISVASFVGESNNWDSNQKYLIWAGTLAAVPGVLLLRWWYRKLLPRYQTGLRPWLWQHLGPFDGVLWFSLLYLWLGLGIPVFIQDLLPNPIEAAWILVMPFVGIVLIHHLRLWLTKHRAHLPPWGPVLSSIQVLVREMSLQMTVVRALRWAGRVLVMLMGLLPALIGAAICVGGLAWCRPFFMDGEADAWLTAVFWSGPFAFTVLTVHALNHSWWLASRTPWWRPLVPLAWCVWIPVLPCLATWGLVWSGHAQAQPGVLITGLALVVALCLPLIARHWLHRRHRTTG